MAASVLSEHAAAQAQRQGSAAPVEGVWIGSAAGLIWLAIAVAAGAALRVAAARQTLFGDELASYWDIHSHGFGGLISALRGTHIEITPPLFFALAWLTSHIGPAAAWLRLPSLIAGTLTIPAVYAVGARTVGRAAGLVAAALTALSPFMIYYGSEARAYALLMLLLTLSTLALVRAAETGRARWWAAYAACSCAALYTHYTGVFYLAAQFLWLLWAHPRRWRAAVLANLAVLVGLAPWASAIVNANNSPTTAIMSALSPFTLHDARIYLEHWSIGYPYVDAGGLSALPGIPALVLLALAFLLALVAAIAARAPESVHARRVALRPPVVLVFALLLATPVGAALESATGTHVFDVRNLAASWPPLALAAAWLLTRPRGRPGFVAAGLAVAAFAIAAVKTLEPRWSKPDSRSAAAFIARREPAGTVVIDGSGFSGRRYMVTPGPLTSLEVALGGDRYRLLRAGAPQEDQHPFGFLDPQVPLASAVARALAAARGGDIAAVTTIPRGGALAPLPLPASYRLAARRVYPGILATAVRIYARAGAGAG